MGGGLRQLATAKHLHTRHLQRGCHHLPGACTVWRECKLRHERINPALAKPLLAVLRPVLRMNQTALPPDLPPPHTRAHNALPCIRHDAELFAA